MRTGHLIMLLFGLSSLLYPVTMFAEGTAELMPAGSSSSCISYIQGNDGTGKEGPRYGQAATDLIYVHIEDISKEVIYYGFTRKEPNSKPLYYQIIAPDGTIVRTGLVGRSSSDSCYIADDGTAAYVGPTQVAGSGSGGYTALEIRPTMTGDYAIQFNVNHPTDPRPSESRFFVHPFDVTVADLSDPANPAAIDGRLFSYKWHLNTNSGSNKACMNFYTWTADSMVLAVDMNEIQPWGYSVSFNDHGTLDTDDLLENRKSRMNVNSSVPEFRVFLNEPDLNVYPSGNPGYITYVSIDGCPETESYCINVLTTKPGEMNVYLDLDGDGKYQDGTRDRYFPYQSDKTGEVCIPWDGRDGYGDLVADVDTGQVVVEFLAGVLHYPVYDPENHKLGFNCQFIRPVGLTPRMYFDNSEIAIGTVNLLGCTSGCNIWSGNRGNNAMVNTWFNAPTSADTAIFELNPLCSPTVVNDTSCAKSGLSVFIPILGNDSDYDNDIDSSSVTYSIPKGVGTAHYNQYDKVLVFTPDSDVSQDSFFLSYNVCDNTADSAGGPLCRTADILITMNTFCPEATTLFRPDPSTDLDRDTHINVYPNPARGKITVDIHDERPVSLTLFDIHGRVVEKKLSKKLRKKVKFETRNLDKGIYLLQVILDWDDVRIYQIEVQQ